MEIGFIGLGTMGAGMASNIHSAGIKLRVCNRSREKLQPFHEMGLATSTEPLNLSACDLIVTMLADDHALSAMMIDSGLVSVMKSGALHVSCSTISLQLVAQLMHLHQSSDSHFISAPVSGRGDLAASGNLFVIAGGKEEQLARCDDLFAAIGCRTYVVGRHPADAMVVKLAINQMIASSLAVIAESTALVERFGVDPEIFFQFFSSSLFSCKVFSVYGELIAKKRYQPANFSVALGNKDLRFVKEASDEVDLKLRMAQTCKQILNEAEQTGFRDSDWSALAEVIRRQ